MSANLMLVCSKRNQDYAHERYAECIFVDETSMGCPWSDFGKLFTRFREEIIDDEFINKVNYWSDVLEVHESADNNKIIEWLKDHINETLEFECW